jgi:hypothetical protein
MVDFQKIEGGIGSFNIWSNMHGKDRQREEKKIGAQRPATAAR